MALLNKNLNEYKYGFSSSKKRFGINYWRFFFAGIDSVTGYEQMFFLEFQMVNPWISPAEVQLSFKSKTQLTEKDLAYALAGTESAKNLKTEEVITPSYCSIRIGKLGHDAKQLCTYFPVRDAIFSHKPFGIQYGNNVFDECNLKGSISLSEEAGTYKPEYLCNEGDATWELLYEVENGFGVGNSGDANWFPSGLQTRITGKVVFDGIEYKVRRDSCRGYSEKYWGKSLPEPWYHISATTLTSEITGKTLFGSAFAVQGVFDDKIAFIGKFEDQEIIFDADKSKGKVETAWDCTQMPEAKDPDMNLLHWSCSFTSKNWVVDIDVYCKAKNLFNRNIELPDGSRKVSSVISGISESGEIKLYKRKGPNLEQIEHAKLHNVVCEFGHKEEFEF